jgi:hypothetical protein
MKNTPATRSRIVLASTVALAAAGVAWALLSPASRPAGSAVSPPGSAAGSGAEIGPARGAGVTREGNSIPATESGLLTSGAGSVGHSQGSLAPDVGVPKSRPRSPLERSPGYYPPDDPESMSVITGRRDAPLVDLGLNGGASSADDLGRELVLALNARDEAAVHALAVTRQEFEVILWREFPESRPVTHITAADAWEMSVIQSHAGVSRAVGAFGNRNLEFIRVESRATAPFRNFALHRGIEIVTKDPATSQEVRLRFATSFVERHGRFKVLAFKD